MRVLLCGVFAVQLAAHLNTPLGPGRVCHSDRECRSRVCRGTGRRRHCHGPATLPQRAPCVDDGDCASRNCGENAGTDWPGGRRCQ